jgi:hypothetical protein
MTKKAIRLALCTMLFALSVSADAQQSGKIFRIGFLDGSTAAGTAVHREVFRQELSKLGWIEGRISPLSTGLPSRSATACRSLRRTWFVLRLI